MLDIIPSDLPGYPRILDNENNRNIVTTAAELSGKVKRPWVDLKNFDKYRLVTLFCLADHSISEEGTGTKIEFQLGCTVSEEKLEWINTELKKIVGDRYEKN